MPEVSQVALIAVIALVMALLAMYAANRIDLISSFLENNGSWF